MARRVLTELILPGDPAFALGAAPKQYVDSHAPELSATPPPDPYPGKLWLIEETGQLAYWTGTEWVQVASPPGNRNGWQPIPGGTGVITATAVSVIPVPAGVYSAVRLRLVGRLSSPGVLTLRVNSDANSIYAHTVNRYNADGTLDAAGSGAATSAVAQIGQWGNVINGNTLTLEISDTDFASPCVWEGRAHRRSLRRSEFWGALIEARLLSSIRIATDTEFVDTRYWLQGYLP